MDSNTTAWECTICGEIIKGPVPPEFCPVCAAGRDKFVRVDLAPITFEKNTLEKFIIVGGGPAGTTAAEEIRKRNRTCTIEIVSRENVLGYNRPMLTKGIMGSLDMSNLFIKDYSWYVENNIKFRLNQEVLDIDVPAKIVKLASGETREYDKLIITTGADSFLPPFKGVDKKGIFTIRTLMNINELKNYISTGIKKAAVIGGGVLGLEAASELSKAGLDVTVIEASPVVMGKQLDAEGATVLREAMDAAFVKAQVGSPIAGIQGGDTVTGVELEDGTVVPCEVLIISTGVRQNVTLAQKAGAQITRSIVVNEKMETGVPDIYAAGDCAEFNGVNYAIWPQAINMAKVAASNATGDSTIYKATIPAVSFEGLGTAIFSVGEHGSDPGVVYETKKYEDKEKRIYKKLYFRDKHFCGGILIGDTSGVTELLSAYTEKRPIEEMEAIG